MVYLCHMDQNDQKPAGSAQGSQYVNYGNRAGAPGGPRAQIPNRPDIAALLNSSKHHWGTIIVAISATVIVLGAAAYVAYAFILAPELTIERALSHFDREQRVHSNISLTLDAADPALNGASLSMITDTDRSTTDPKAQSVIDLSSPALAGTAEIRYMNNTIFGNIVRLPAQLSYARPMANLWYSATPDSVQALFAKLGSMPEPDASGKMTLTQIFSTMQSKGLISKPYLAGVTFSGGMYAWQYKVDVNKQALMDLIEPLLNVVPEGNNIRGLLDSAVLEPVVISVGLVSGDIDQVTMDLAFTAGSSVTGPIATISAAHLKLDYVFTQVDAISAPENATSLDTTIATYILPPPPVSTKTTTKKTTK